jgi:VanZ family protein
MHGLLATRNFRILFLAAAVCVVVAALLPQLEHTPATEYKDKVEHILAFAILAVLARLGFPDARGRLIVERLSFMGAGIEVLQSIPALHRDCSVTDWIVDTLAAAAVVAVYALWRRIPTKAA